MSAEESDGVDARFLRVTPLCSAGRRALWARWQDEPMSEHVLLVEGESEGAYLELRGGREGDDTHVVLRAGEVVTAEQIRELVHMLISARWAADPDGDLT
jgi:hypothetical protein